MAYRTLDHDDLSLFKNRLWNLMEEKKITTAKQLAKILYDNALVTVNQKDNYDDLNTVYWRAVSSVEKKIQHHLNSDDTKKLQGEFAEAYCKFFECSSDYLFGFISSPTHAITDIKKETGLSEHAIEWLQELNKTSHITDSSYAWARNSIQALNDLLEQREYFMHSVLLQIAEYCVWRAEYEKGTSANHNAKNIIQRFQVALFSATNGLTDCIKEIYKKHIKESH